MELDWEATTLGQFLESEGGSIVTGPFGTVLKASEYTPTGVPVISVSEVSFGRIQLKEHTPRVDPSVTHRLAKYLLKKDDIVFARKGAGTAVERSALVLEHQDGWFLGSDGIRIRLPKKCSPLFISYWLQSQRHRNWMKQHAVGTTMPALNEGIIKRIPLQLPPLAEQKAIAAVLGALDDKIELNRRMNATLESMARALFQSWFVDFDPVRAKLDGRQPTGMNAETAALFPDSFQESTLGPIPCGWAVDTIKNRASNIQYGFTQSATVEPIGPHFLRITDLRGGAIDWGSVPYCEATDDEREKYRVMDGDIFIARTGASTGDNIYVIEPPPALFASYLVRVQFTSRGIGRLVGAFTRTPDYANHVAGIIGGSAQPNASAQALAAASLVYPSEELANAFYRIVRPLDQRRAANDRESRTLATLRDTLLPKLLSGDLTLPAAFIVTQEAIA